MNVNIYQYDDFRLFLKDAYQALKEADPSLSHRKFAQMAGFKNPGYLNDVIKGFKRLSENASYRIAKALKLTANECDFLWLLARYGQRKSEDEAPDLLRQIAFRRKRSLFGRHNPGLSRYYEDCRYPIVRAAVETLDFRGDYEQLGSFLDPPIPAYEAKRYIRDLCEWGLLEQRSDGRYYTTSTFIEPCRTMGGQVRRINREWIKQALDVQKRHSVDKRHVSTILMSVNRKTEKKLLTAVEEFREKVFDLLKEESEPPEKVMQLNIQLFPQSRSRS
ncbi:MAG: TIGR02147 family protein [Chitinivibrionales bacterium]|nr:TIGR02147 family protein [Chitinivibrionales bacterium]MBD3359003.1 TIGR02147 family protein [Chitinivibrionales bacterium]